MKPTLLFATLSMVLASPTAFAKSELETLRSKCSEQELQIRQLEEENARLRSDGHEPRPTSSKAEVAESAPQKSATPPTATGSSIYTVKAGDSMEKIARKVGSDPQKLAKLNGLKTNSIIHPGQKLKVPGTPAAASGPLAAASSPASRAMGKTHTIRNGETFFSISKKYGISTKALAAANPKVKASALRTGQVISLGGDSPSTTMISASNSHAKASAPIEKSVTPAASQSTAVRESAPAAAAAAPAPAAEPKPAPAPAASTETPVASTEKKIRPITIEGEMTYGEFASKYGTDAERLNALNGLDLTQATILAKGSELYVPAQP
jgi:LysM repeat protein